MDGLGFVLALVTALGAGLVAGFFFAFSTLVMPGFASLPPTQGIAGFQAVDAKVSNPLFMGTFMGTTVLCVVGAIYAFTAWDEPGALFLLIGSALYLIGTFLVTAVIHVPRNNNLAKLDPTSREATEQWPRFLVVWTTWNHVRTIAALAATVLFIVALR